MKQITKFNFSKLLTLAVFMSFLFGYGRQAKAEIPNGDGDLLWEKGMGGRFVNDAVFHPINGNIIAAVNHEIWEIDPKDGHTIRVFEGGSASGEYDQFEGIKITSDGKYVVSDGGSGIEGLLIWDYETGKIKQVFDKGGPNRGSLGIYPDNQRVIFFTFQLTGSENNELVQYNIGTNQIEKKVSIFPDLIEKLSLSKDGKYLAIGKSRAIGGGHWKYSMDLLDAETLTPIKGLGGLTDQDMTEFRDVQISNDDQYFGFVTDESIYIFNNKTNEQKIIKGGITLQFTNDSKKVFIQQDTAWNKFITYIADLNSYEPIYEYKKLSLLNYRFNSNNELMGGSYSLLYFSNHWYTVGVNEPAGGSQKIAGINYTNNILQINTEGIDIIDDLIITDNLGKRLYQKNKIAITNNQAEIPLFLQSGNYLIKLIANGKELTGKFIVVR